MRARHKHLLYLLVAIFVYSGTISARFYNSILPDAPVQHVVQPGETITDIAEMYAVSAHKLAERNRLAPSQPLLQGQILNFPTQQPAHIQPYQLAQAEYGNYNAQYPKKKNHDSEREQGLNGTPYAYYGNGEPVSDALKSFASNYGLPVIISPKITSIVNGKIGPLAPVPFLDALAQLNGLLWYFDGDTLYVYDGQEIEKKIISLNHLTTNRLKNILIDMGLWDNRYGWRERPNEGLVYLAGPPRYINLVSETARLIDLKTGEKQKSQLAFEVFPLKYAWAEDHTISYRNNQVTIPGVATLLRQIVLRDTSTNSTPTDSDTSTYTKSLSPATPITGSQSSKSAGKNENKANENIGVTEADNVVINADRRSNAVIIHDLASKMPMYQHLISTLDKPLSQIEINVSIIDVDTTSIDELGVNWKLNSSGGNGFFSFDPSSSLSSPPSSTILKVTAGRLLSQVKLLATRNKAKILSRPSVLTLDNMEAVLDNNQTFYVSVNGSNSGDNTAQLYPITSGSVLKVTPRIIKEKSGRRIHLDVNIQDGNSQNSNLNGVSLPVVKNTTISTQAMIEENESLLVGGYFYEKTSDSVNKIPLLGDLPVIGQLFRQKSKNHTKNVRLFLITPKIVTTL